MKTVMKTLILGHGRIYKKDLDTRCSPIDVDEWFNDPYDCVDDSEEVKPDIVFDLTQSWKFAPNSSYDRIIDCTGGTLQLGHSGNKPVSSFILQQVQRILKPYGLFYPDRHYKNTIYQQDCNGELVLLENKIVPQYLVPYVSESELEKIRKSPLVQSGTYTIEDYIESDRIKAEYHKQMEKWERYCCNICNTKFSTKENHQTHLASEQHKRQKSIKIIRYSCPIDDELIELYQVYKTKNVSKIIKEEENFGISI